MRPRFPSWKIRMCLPLLAEGPSPTTGCGRGIQVRSGTSSRARSTASDVVRFAAPLGLKAVPAVIPLAAEPPPQAGPAAAAADALDLEAPEQPFVLFVATLAILFLAARGAAHAAWRRASVAAVLSAGLGLAVGKVISELVDRARPFVASNASPSIGSPSAR